MQDAPRTVFSDVDCNAELNIDSDRTEAGHFGINIGINIQRTNYDRASIQVDSWSAGCRVVCDPLQFNYFLDVCEKGARERGNAFTYTLLTQADLES